ncbi:MAG: hypothetical protein ACR2HQ_09460, partial [Ilumatobacteraceae bacterium]
MGGVLARYVDEFVDGIGAELEALAGRDHRGDVTIEAGDLVAAVIDSDDRLTDDELEAWLDDIGPRLEPPVLVTSTRLREGGMLEGRRRWLEQPSTLFDLLVKADADRGGGRAVRYYDAAIRLAHAAAAVDLVPSPDEIAAIDRYRDVLLAAFDAAGVPRPGRPVAAETAEGARGAGVTPVGTTPGSTTQLPPVRPPKELV